MAENITKEEISYPKFLDNKPCKEDLFKGQSHKKIAQNIANVLENNNNVKIIGIDGGWGSGKSNMVYLLKDILEKTNPNKYRLFIYDAWGHQEDLCRRSILEELTESLTDETQKAILNNNKWKEKLNNLLSKKRKLKTKTIPKLSCGIIFSALAVVITPILNIVTSNLESICCKVLITSIPLLVIVLYIIILFIGNLYRYLKKKNFLWCLKCTMTSTFNIYTDKQKENTIFETISEEEASSREFRSWMHEIDEDLGDNVVIIVFDNMDRLPTSKVQELWASIHTFFADEDYKKIKVIVPFDRKHIKSAFKSEDIIVERENNNSKCYGNDFINKTFDAIYRVSPPVMSDWKLYFEERWKDAFNSDVSNKVTQIYDLLSDVITPREIIAFINEFVSIKQISDGNIPDEYIALFIFGKDIISDNPNNEILVPSYIGPLDFRYKNDLDLPKFISALYYQLPPEEALDTIYTEKLKQALDDPNKDQMDSLQSNENLFFPILENAITKITNIPNAVQYLEKCLKNKNPQKEQVFWDCIYDKVKQQPIIEPLQQYQKILLTRITNKDEYLKKILLDLYNIQDLDIISYYDSIKQLSEIDDINPYILLKEKEVNAKSFVDFVEQAKDEHAKYKIICKQDDLNKYFSELNVEDIKILNSIPFIKDEYTLDSYKKRLQVLLNENDNIKIVYDRLKEIERPIELKLNDDKIYTYFNSTKEYDEFYYDLICMRLAKLNNFYGGYQSPFDQVFKLNNDSIVEKVAERIEYYITYGEILLNINNMGNYPLYKEVAKKLTENSYGISSMNILKVLQKYGMIKDNLEINSEILINRLNARNTSAKSKITVDNINSVSITFFKDIIEGNISNEIAEHCIDTAKNYLETKTKEDWMQSIIENKFDCQLLLIIKHNIQNCFEAFGEVILGKIDSNNNLTKDLIKKLIDLFEKHNREFLATFNNVRDRFCDKGVTMTEDLFDCFGEWLLKYAKLEDKQSALRTIFPLSILDEKENIKVLLSYREKMIKIVEKAEEENKDFKDKIKSLLDGEYKENEEFKSFARKIGIEMDIDKAKDSEDVDESVKM